MATPTDPVSRIKETLQLHRWCQWISHHHPGGVYDGEEGKRSDFASSLPPYLLREHLLPLLRGKHGQAVVLAEEWHTVDAVLHLDWLLQRAGVREQVVIFWNANNTFGFDRIDWNRLQQAAVITTVSRYMRQLMWGLGVDPLVVPNGLSDDAYEPPDRSAAAEFRHRLSNRTVLAKVARWDPDKRWLLAIDTVQELKRQGCRPLLIARGGLEEHGSEVFARATAAGLRVVDRNQSNSGPHGLIDSLGGLDDADIVNLRSSLAAEACRVLFRGAGAVLANSGHEPFGLVGLETMAVGGLACTGGTGEDYAIPGWNGLVLQRQDPQEFVGHFRRLLTNPSEERRIRRRGQSTARWYAWREIVQRSFLPYLPGIPLRKTRLGEAPQMPRGSRSQQARAIRPIPQQVPIAAMAG